MNAWFMHAAPPLTGRRWALAAGATWITWAGLLPGPCRAAPPVPAAPAAAAQAVPDTLAQRLKPCMACHGAEGRASREGYLPRIAGKPAAYLYEQLRNFRDGRRSNPVMAGFLAHQRDDYLREIAAYFAALDLPATAAPALQADSGALGHGQRLVRQGDGASKLPACTACHGTALTGSAHAVPGLLGLPRDYLIAQMGAWRNSTRRALAPDCMADIAQRLTAQDLVATATWLATQPVPANGAKPGPADGPVATPPLRCGTIEAHP